MRGQRVRRDTLALLVLLAALAGNYFLGPLPFSLPGAAYDGTNYARTSHDAALDEAVRMIPPGAVVSVNHNAGGQLSARLHQLALGRLVLDPAFQSVYAKDGVYVFKRVAPNQGPGPLPSGSTSQPTPQATASP